MRCFPFMILIVAMFVATAMGTAPSSFARDGAAPEINRPFAEPDYGAWVQRFERPGREVYDKRADIVTATGVRAGMHVADIGAGTGLFTLLFADAVGPSGTVYAVDVSPGFIQNIEERAQKRGLENVVGIINTQKDTRLPPGSIDLAFMSDTYHHFEHPLQMLASVHSALRPGGGLVVVDFEREENVGSQWVLSHVRAGKETVINEIEAAGFELVEDRPLLRENFFLQFKKR